jgi:hypothetical protein
VPFLLVFIGFYWFLLVFIGFYWFLLVFIGFLSVIGGSIARQSLASHFFESDIPRLKPARGCFSQALKLFVTEGFKT